MRLFTPSANSVWPMFAWFDEDIAILAIDLLVTNPSRFLQDAALHVQNFGCAVPSRREEER